LALMGRTNPRLKVWPRGLSSATLQLRFAQNDNAATVLSFQRFTYISMIPSALEHVQKITRSGDRLAVFLDYDGTLTPIVSHPQDAWLSDSMRQTLHALAARVPVGILSGRDLD